MDASINYIKKNNCLTLRGKEEAKFIGLLFKKLNIHIHSISLLIFSFSYSPKKTGNSNNFNASSYEILLIC